MNAFLNSSLEYLQQAKHPDSKQPMPPKHQNENPRGSGQVAETTSTSLTGNTTVSHLITIQLLVQAHKNESEDSSRDNSHKSRSTIDSHGRH